MLHSDHEELCRDGLLPEKAPPADGGDQWDDVNNTSLFRTVRACPRDSETQRWEPYVLEGPILRSRDVALAPRGLSQPSRYLRMLPLTETSSPRLPFQEVVAKAINFPHESQRIDFIGTKVQANKRLLLKLLRHARFRCRSSFETLVRQLHIAEMRNAREVAWLLVDLQDLDCDEDVLRCLACGKYDSGHAAMQLIDQLGALRELSRCGKAAIHAFVEIRRDYLDAMMFLHECWRTRGQMARRRRSVPAAGRP